MSSSGRTNITKRACDGCKIRKIKCGGTQPCQRCISTGIACTYIRTPLARGRQKMRVSTRQIIEQTQRQHGFQHLESNPTQETSTRPAIEGASDRIEFPAEQTTEAPKSRTRIPTSILALQLYIYHVRMFPVWPIVKVEDTVAALQRDEDGTDLETYALATAVAAATMAQLRLGEGSSANSIVMAAEMEAECQRARVSFNHKQRVSLNNVRTSFFLHVYHEDQQTGGSESFLYLREAISMAQMMYLHRESSYASLSASEQQLRRRILWLLFVTERGVCVLHKYPVAIRTNITLPVVDNNDESHVLPGFLNLVNLFWTFDQSGMFNIDPDQDTDAPAALNGVGLDVQFLEMLQKKLQEAPTEQEAIEDVQKADICVTRHWMRMILWKLYSKSGTLVLPSSVQVMSEAFPVVVAREFLNIISKLPNSAVEAHGFGMELKIFQIASSVADAISKLALLPRALVWNNEDRPSNVLTRLHLILSSFRGGGNKTLVDMLYSKMSEAQTRTGPTLLQQPSSLEPEQRNINQSQHQRVAECHEEDDDRQVSTHARDSSNITTSSPVPSDFNDISRGVNRMPNLRLENGTAEYSTNPTGPEYLNLNENQALGQQQPQSTLCEYPTLLNSTSSSPSSSSPRQRPNPDGNITPIQRFIQQQQQNWYNMNNDTVPQVHSQPSPPSRPGSSSSLSIQVQMMMEDLLYQQSQPSQSNSQLSSGFENALFPMGNINGGNDNFQGSILGEEYPIIDG